ncbi:NUDIX hydrolase [Aurantiacibacter aquimixticola]|uniref:NUDIX domain-containing protein n=1 Tax=Aurantiacibacter aquimixticola TaxID=1958945 RepID=A0A419RWQ6_9SPHN|nr:NUDIX domain-containing protein [Aurantiacibacter aquimixticola]RJY10226.1 NUDIX domain-containing protein [Aurantiacibacter aquimixticola]
MTEVEFLQSYDPAAFPRVAVAVDVVLLSVVEGKLVALLQNREEQPAKGKWALPGGFVREGEGLDDAATRVLAAKAHLERVWLEQLYTFGAPDRDPRMRVVTVAYFALLPERVAREAVEANDGLMLAETDALPPLAFDHADILTTAIARLRGKLDYVPLVFALLPRKFTLRELQHAHEAILGKTFAKPAFRRRMLDQGWIAPTGEFETGTPYRPAELYRRKPGTAPDKD